MHRAGCQSIGWFFNRLKYLHLFEQYLPIEAGKRKWLPAIDRRSVL